MLGSNVQFEESPLGTGIRSLVALVVWGLGTGVGLPLA